MRRMAWPTSGGERADTVAPVAVERAAGVMVAAWVARVSAAATELVAMVATGVRVGFEAI